RHARRLGWVGEASREIQQHRVDHVAVVVIRVEDRSVAINSITKVPLLELAKRGFNANGIMWCAKKSEACLHHSDKTQPVVEGRTDSACRLQGIYQERTSRRTQCLRELSRCPQQGLAEKRSVDETLPAVIELHVVGRC